MFVVGIDCERVAWITAVRGDCMRNLSVITKLPGGLRRFWRDGAFFYGVDPTTPIGQNDTAATKRHPLVGAHCVIWLTDGGIQALEQQIAPGAGQMLKSWREQQNGGSDGHKDFI
jgi:hypothetical protein